MKNYNNTNVERTVFEKLLYLGIATFFLWPFIQLWSVNAIPLFDSDNHLRASIALENLLENAMAKPYVKMGKKDKYKPIVGYEDIELSGKIDVFPHPRMDQMTVIRAQVRWGNLLVGKTMSMEYLRTRTRP